MADKEVSIRPRCAGPTGDRIEAARVRKAPVLTPGFLRPQTAREPSMPGCDRSEVALPVDAATEDRAPTERQAMVAQRGVASALGAAAVAVGMLLGAGAAAAEAPAPCAEKSRVLRVGFYHDFAPVSYSADRDPGSAGFHEHRGYEADLLTALEAMGAARFSRRAVGGGFAGIWLKAATPEYDLIGGGITIRQDRTRDAAGRAAVVFTSGHIAFVQTLLVRAWDAGRFSGYRGFSPEVRIAAIPGTTGEERLLHLTGFVGPDGALRPGVRVHLASGQVLEAGGSERLVITAASSSPRLERRRRLQPPGGVADMPQVVYFQEEAAHLEALRAGAVDAVARGMIGNADAVAESVGALAIGARDPRQEFGGFALSASERTLAACLSRAIEHLTDSGRIGYEQWRADTAVFLRRAEEARERNGG